MNLTVNNVNFTKPRLLTSNSNTCVGDSNKTTCTILSIGKDSTIFNWKINGINHRSKSNVYNYLPSSTFTISCEVSIYSNSCVKTEYSDTLTINSVPIPSVNIVIMSSNINANVTGGTSPYSYIWKNNWSILPDTNSIITPVFNGKYIVTVVDSNGCTAKDSILNYNISLIENNKIENLEFYPNPTMEKIYIELTNQKCTLIIIDSQGKLVRKELLITGKNTIDVSKLSKGVYYLNLEMDNEVIKKGKVVLE